VDLVTELKCVEALKELREQLKKQEALPRK
jgi:hypothetical protein